MKKLNKNILLSLGTLTTIATPVMVVVSCSNNNDPKTSLKKEETPRTPEKRTPQETLELLQSFIRKTLKGGITNFSKEELSNYANEANLNLSEAAIDNLYKLIQGTTNVEESDLVQKGNNENDFVLSDEKVNIITLLLTRGIDSIDDQTKTSLANFIASLIDGVDQNLIAKVIDLVLNGPGTATTSKTVEQLFTEKVTDILNEIPSISDVMKNTAIPFITGLLPQLPILKTGLINATEEQIRTSVTSISGVLAITPPGILPTNIANGLNSYVLPLVNLYTGIDQIGIQQQQEPLNNIVKLIYNLLHEGVDSITDKQIESLANTIKAGQEINKHLNLVSSTVEKIKDQSISLEEKQNSLKELLVDIKKQLPTTAASRIPTINEYTNDIDAQEELKKALFLDRTFILAYPGLLTAKYASWYTTTIDASHHSPIYSIAKEIKDNVNVIDEFINNGLNGDVNDARYNKIVEIIVSILPEVAPILPSINAGGMHINDIINQIASSPLTATLMIKGFLNALKPTH